MSVPLFLFCRSLLRRCGKGVFFHERPGQGYGPGDEGPPEEYVQDEDRHDLAVFAYNSYDRWQENERKPQHAEDDDQWDDQQ